MRFHGQDIIRATDASQPPTSQYPARDGGGSGVHFPFACWLRPACQYNINDAVNVLVCCTDSLEPAQHKVEVPLGLRAQRQVYCRFDPGLWHEPLCHLR
jgi:hypothetical protein